MSLSVDTPVAGARATSADQPRRRADRDTTPGRCGNLDYCSIGMQRIVVQVPLNQAFVCPECASRLRPPGRAGGARRPWVLPLLRITVLAIGMTISMTVGYLLGRVQPAMREAAQVAGADLQQAGAAMGLDAPSKPQAASALSGAQPPAEAPARLDPLGSAAPIFVAQRPYPAHDVSPDIAHPPSRLIHEARFGQVIIDCRMEPVLTHPACKLTEIRGADAVSAAALAWLQTLAVQYAPTQHNGTPILQAHRWRVVFEDYAGPH